MADVTAGAAEADAGASAKETVLSSIPCVREGEFLENPILVANVCLADLVDGQLDVTSKNATR
ncbi:hypothetical protein [Sphingomonas xinjiangensis]|uniref:Uncharacterized protein n=1 Tax=Sphingomonas xinjiangensis TaxID=643568 RepID=A0A840YH01_9SPHN|nr:hypothetical protein [Sphingomonas xinjiangensis]MBB5712154.1 hypothetical protein [Sphingomonas xinjiangensis]